MRTKYIVFFTIGIFLIISVPFLINNNTASIVLITIQTLCAFITVALAITLFDKYQAGTNLNNKAINLVIDYIEFLKNTSLYIENYISGQKSGFEMVTFSKTERSIDMMTSTKIYVDLWECFEFYGKLKKYIDSPWMPKQIRNASNFLLLDRANKIYTEEDIDLNFCVLRFPSSTSKTTNVGLTHMVSLNGIEKKNEFDEKKYYLLVCIEKWVKSQATDINITL